MKEIIEELKDASVWFYVCCLCSMFALTFTYRGEYFVSMGLLTVALLIIFWKPFGRNDEDESK